jgi:hypothetical protein
MGKAENIKRAKRLKEAKRKREQDALIAAGLGPAGKSLQQRNLNNGIETQLNTSKIKYSELLKEFVHPIVKHSDDIGIIKTKYIFGSFAWNAAIIKGKNHEDYLTAKKNALLPIGQIPEAEQLFDEMVKRKEEEFTEYQNIIMDIEIKKISGLDYDLTVATTPLKII